MTLEKYIPRKSNQYEEDEVTLGFGGPRMHEKLVGDYTRATLYGDPWSGQVMIELHNDKNARGSYTICRPAHTSIVDIKSPGFIRKMKENPRWEFEQRYKAKTKNNLLLIQLEPWQKENTANTADNE